MTDFKRIALSLSMWFAERNIPMDSLTVILNLKGSNAAMAVDSALRRDFSSLLIDMQERGVDLRAFQMAGVHFKIESPLHD